MHRTPSKRSRILRRTVVYGIMTFAVLSVVTLLVLVMLGYRFNRDTSSIQQGGLVQFASRPTDARVTIGQANLANTTPSKITVNPGSYKVTMERAGYHSWQKQVTVQAGKVLWLNYAQLVPTTIDTQPVRTYDSISQVLASPNGTYMALLKSASDPQVVFTEINNDTPEQEEIVIPTTLLPEGTARLTMVEWSDDSRRVLLKATQGSQTQWLLVDRTDEDETINLTNMYGSDIVSYEFDPRSNDRLFALTKDKSLRFLNTSDEALSPIIARNVESITDYGSSALFYVQRISKTERQLAYVSLGESKPRVVKTIQGNDPVRIAATSYFSEPYVAFSSGPELEVYRLESLPASSSTSSLGMKTIASETLARTPSNLSLRTGGRFVIAEYPGGVATYDNELDAFAQTSLKGFSGKLRWLDRYHFYTTDGSNLTVTEFDGTNQRVITPLNTNFDAVQTDNGTFIYSVAKTDDGYKLQRSRMILE